MLNRETATLRSFRFKALVIAAVSFLFSGCYTLTQGFTMLGYLYRAVPLESLGEGEEVSETEARRNREFVERVRDIRAFAQDYLGLRDTKNYTKYVALDRDYLAAVVSGTAKDSFTPHEWRYPIIGKAPYKGFFKVEGARREAEKLQKQDLDVWVRGVDAFSTLGWFKDPLYSYMRDYPAHSLADLLIHELLHATVYLKGQSNFNEELAEFVGREGARLYIEKTFGAESAEMAARENSQKDSRVFIAFIGELIGELEALYAGEASREEKLRAKERIIENAQEKFAREYDSLFSSENYRYFSELRINNAYLSLFRLYYGERDYYEELYTIAGKDLPRLIAAAKTLKAGNNPREDLARALGVSEEEQPAPQSNEREN